MKSRSKLLGACCAIAILMAMPAAAWAQDATAQPQPQAQQQQQQDEEIIVTATHRSQSLHEVPFSVNAQTADDIARTGATNLEEVSRNVAGLTIQNPGPVELSRPVSRFEMRVIRFALC